MPVSCNAVLAFCTIILHVNFIIIIIIIIIFIIIITLFAACFLIFYAVFYVLCTACVFHILFLLNIDNISLLI